MSSVNDDKTYISSNSPSPAILLEVKNNYLFVLLFFCYLQLFAQSDSSQVLPVAIIKSKAIRQANTGGQAAHWDATQISKNNTQDIASIIAAKSGLFVKNYGGGSLATTSLRGGSAGHTVVTWNGFTLQSPMLGQLDFSLLPAAFVDEVDLHYGGETALWGSGAIGGLIALKNKFSQKKGVQINVQSSFGSFGLWNEQVKIQFGKGKVHFKTRLFHKQAKNNFSYLIREDLPKRVQQHAAIQQNGLLQEIHWQINPKQQLSTYIWYQISDREIPTTTVQTTSLATQKDESLRTTLNWKYLGDQHVLQSRLGFFREELFYEDGPAQFPSQFSTFIAEVEDEWFLNEQQQLLIGINQTYTEAESNGYQNIPTDYRAAIFAGFHQQLGKLKFQFNIRQEWADGKFTPFVPSIGIEFQALKWLQFKGKITRNYRLPTFNDRFWNPGGNPDLLAENGWSEEASIAGKWTLKKHTFSYSSTIFNRKIKNWILWSKKENQFFWSANNIAEVWSRGLEQRFSYHFSTKNIQQELSAGHDFVLSTNQQTLQFPKINKGDQLYYVPKHQFFASYSFRWKTVEMSYQHRFTGAVRGINTDLESYQLGHLKFQFEWNKKKLKTRFFFHINNIWDTSYRVIERRAMPGRNFLVGFGLTL